MSYFLTEKNQKRINNSALTGEQVLLSVKKVFDAGISRRNIVDEIELDRLPDKFKMPLSFASAQNSQLQGNFARLNIERLPNNPKTARVVADIRVPLIVNFFDANGQSGSANAAIELNYDVVLAVPEPSIIPYALETVVSAISQRGQYLDGLRFGLEMQITAILKTVIDADVLVPVVEYAKFPALVNFGDSQNYDFFDAPDFRGC